MIARICIATVFTIIFTATAINGVETRLIFEYQENYSFGNTEYIMEIRQPDGAGGILALKSQLEFPLDGFMMGGHIGFDFRKDTISNWIIKAGLATNLQYPKNNFEDHDYWTGQTGVGYFDGKFSYTESRVEVINLIASLNILKSISHSKNYTLFIQAGYRYQKIEQTAFGYDGWQIDIFNDPDFDVITLSDPSVEAIHYKVNYHTPFLGMKLDWHPTGYFVINTDASIMMAMVDDYDNHLLRGKKAVADGTGYGLKGKIGLRHYFGGHRTGNYYVQLQAEVFHTSISTKQTQSWYQDEGPITAGTVIPDIPHDINSLQFTVNLSLGFMFNLNSSK